MKQTFKKHHVCTETTFNFRLSREICITRETQEANNSATKALIDVENQAHTFRIKGNLHHV